MIFLPRNLTEVLFWIGENEMRIEQLRYVVTVADCHSLTLASEQLHISRQNISKAIKQLEEELNIKIFRRSNQGVFLTSKGQKFYCHASEVLDNVAAIEKEFSETQANVESLQGVLSLNLHATLYALLHKSIQIFIEKYPLVTINIYMRCDNNFESGKVCLQEGIHGLSILKTQLTSLCEIYPQYDFYCIKEEPLKVILSKHHVLANQRSLSLKTLYRYPSIFFGSEASDRSLLNKLFLQRNLRPNIYLKTNDYYTALEIVSAGQAYCFGSQYIPHSMIHFVNENLIALPLSENLILSHILMLPKEEKLKKVNQAFLRQINQIFGDDIAIK